MNELYSFKENDILENIFLLVSIKSRVSQFGLYPSQFIMGWGFV